jgi:hypothetical protein
MRSPTRGDRAIDWIEKYCLYPAGPERGQRVRLSQHQREIIRTIYDHPAGRQPRPISSQPLAAYLALLHVCGARRCCATSRCRSSPPTPSRSGARPGLISKQCSSAMPGTSFVPSWARVFRPQREITQASNAPRPSWTI